MEWDALIIASAICLGAGVLTGLTGFGFSVFAVPLLLLVLPAQHVVVVALALVVATSVVLLLSRELRAAVDLRTALGLWALSLAGLPLGALIMQAVDANWVVALTGAVLLGYAVWRLRATGAGGGGLGWMITCGLLGGALTTSTGLNGPAVAMYVSGQARTPEQQVATMAVYVGGISACGFVLLMASGQVSADLATPLPALGVASVVGTILGRWVGARAAHKLDRLTLLLLAAMGLWCLVRSAWSLVA